MCESCQQTQNSGGVVTGRSKCQLFYNLFVIKTTIIIIFVFAVWFHLYWGSLSPFMCLHSFFCAVVVLLFQFTIGTAIVALSVEHIIFILFGRIKKEKI